VFMLNAAIGLKDWLRFTSYWIVHFWGAMFFTVLQ